MRVNRRMGVLSALFFLQFAFVFVQDRHFNQAMEAKREWGRKDAIQAGVPETQVRAIASAIGEMKYEVSSYVQSLAVISLTCNFSMIVVALSARQEDAS